ncbi:MAG: polysaccharide biosynthesis protein [Halobacteriota archaeon]
MKVIPRPALWQIKGTNAFYHHKTVLMTGAAGSIGSQLVRTLLDANPRAAILTDNNEGALCDLEQDLRSSKVPPLSLT